LGIEVNGVIRVGECLVEIRAPFRHARAGAEFAEFALAASDENRVGHDDFIRSDADATLLDDCVNRADEVLVGAHASCDAVHDYADAVCFHILVFFVGLMLDLGFVGRDDVGEELVLIAGPVAGAEDFDFDPTGEAGLFDHGADAANVDAAFAHESTVVEKILRGREPIADMESDVALAGAADFLIQLRIPPDVVDIGCNAHPGVPS
jgi:hypothetical protein